MVGGRGLEEAVLDGGQVRKLTLAICSSGKSDLLLECISSLLGQQVTPGWLVDCLLIVWNGEDRDIAMATAAVNELQPRKLSNSFSILQVREPSVGIPFARNRAIVEALHAGSNWIFFIDDDCIADELLLRQLTEIATENEVHAVAGGWRILPSGWPSSWLPSSFLGPKSYRLNGSKASNLALLPTAYTRNVLFDLDFSQGLPEGLKWFDESLAQVGGSDARFFFGFANSGGRIVYAPDACVTEYYSGNRLNLRWHILRRIRSTQERVLRAPVTGERPYSFHLSMTAILSASWRIPISLMLLPFSTISFRVRRLVGSTMWALTPFLAVVLLKLGFRYHEYLGRFVYARPRWRWQFGEGRL